VLVAELFAVALRILRRHDQTIALLLREQHFLDVASYHRGLYLLDADPENVHRVPARFAIARFRRTHDELRMLNAGKDYWQFYDIEKVAQRIHQLEKARSPDDALVWERIPDDAIPKLYERVKELRRADDFKRDLDDAYRASDTTLSREAWEVEFHKGKSMRIEPQPA
jgi:hypothetical protein